MCGIFGIWQSDGRAVDPAEIRSTSDILAHRGPDGEGYLLVRTDTGKAVACAGKTTDPRLGLPEADQLRGQPFDLVLGHRRLAILDLSYRGHQPMSSPDGTVWITHNGEVYNYRQLRSELRSEGFEFTSETDTEVILAAYQKWGPDCLTRFVGMWAFAIWDNRRRRLFLARDRFGIKPLYYIHSADRFGFASEIKALVHQTGFGFTPDDRSVCRFVAYQLLPDPASGSTFFKGVYALPPACWLTVEPNDSVMLHRYWDLDIDDDTRVRSALDAEAAVQGFREHLRESISLCLCGSVPIGSCLSGGIDSSSIVCSISQMLAAPAGVNEQVGPRPRTFSAVYDTAGPYNERKYVDQVLQSTQAEGYLTYPDGKRLREDLEKLAWHQDEPFATTTIFAQWCVMSRAAEGGVRVLLDGQGADEVLGGYTPFTVFLSELISQRKWVRAYREASAIKDKTGRAILPMLAHAAYHSFPRGFRTTVVRLRKDGRAETVLLKPELARQLCEEKTIAIDQDGPDTLSRHLWASVKHSLPDLLRYEDRNSMAFSLESRVPFLDHRLVSYAFGEAARWRINQGWTKWILRRAMERIVPSQVVWRTDKVGFGTPMADWVSEWIRCEPEYIGERSFITAYLDLQNLRALTSHPDLSQNFHLLWRCIALEAWLRVWHSAGPH
jgi:asparagine synthase (glutamine-hydrolysing)